MTYEDAEKILNTSVLDEDPESENIWSGMAYSMC